MRRWRPGHGHGRRAPVADRTTLRGSPHPDADLEANLADWRRFRRQARTEDVHWIDLLYQAYLTGIVGVVVVVVGSSMIGDNPLTASQLDQVLSDGPAWIGVVAAVALAVGLRSGSQGGPLALERAEVRHVLLAPVDRTAALRAPAIRQLRFLAFVGIVAGAITGQIASHRFEGRALAWVGTGALAGLTLVALGAGIALVASGLGCPRWAATGLGVVLVGLAVADGLDVIAFSPTAPFGELALWPLEWSPLGLLTPLVGVGLVAVGVALLGSTSLEDAERRSRLVGQLRFAATLQDLRTVLVLRRQLAMELPRGRPWVSLPVRGNRRAPVFIRGLRGLLRWPAARLARLVLLALTAGLALRGAWAGTSPLVLLAGLALFVAGLDTTEALAQEVDHPSRRDGSPLDAGTIHLRHVPIGLLGQALVAAVAMTVAAVPGGGQVPTDIAVMAAVPLALGAVAGALVSVLSGPASTGGSWSFAPPEAQGMRLAFRSAWPPTLAILGTLPVLFARWAIERGDPGEPAVVSGGLAIVALFVVVCGWVRLREDIGAFFQQQMEPGRAEG